MENDERSSGDILSGMDCLWCLGNEEMNRMDELTFTLHHPLTDEEWDAIVDVDFEHTDEITFYTKNGKKVDFVKKPQWIPVDFRNNSPEENKDVLLGVRFRDTFKCFVTSRHDYNYWTGLGREIRGELRWQPLPEPYKEEKELMGEEDDNV